MTAVCMLIAFIRATMPSDSIVPSALCLMWRVQGSMPGPVAKLEAKWQEREAEKMRRREAAALVSDPAENAHVFWQVRRESRRV